MESINDEINIIQSLDELIMNGYNYMNIYKEYIYNGIKFKLIQEGYKHDISIEMVYSANKNFYIEEREPTWEVSMNGIRMTVTDIKE